MQTGIYNSLAYSWWLWGAGSSKI